MREVLFPERGTAEWDAAWAALAAELPRRSLGDGTDLAQYDEPKWEVWMFDGIVIDPDGSRWAEFRHRHHPVTERREYVRVEIA